MWINIARYNFDILYWSWYIKKVEQVIVAESISILDKTFNCNSVFWQNKYEACGSIHIYFICG